jgi:hypothetical protein
MKSFRVGVFEIEQGRRTVLLAYTREYSPSQQGCCLHSVEATNGTEAKRAAIAEHRERCMKGARPKAKGKAPTPCAFCGDPDSGHRVRDAIVERIAAGDSIQATADDFGMSLDDVEAILSRAKREEDERVGEEPTQ